MMVLLGHQKYTITNGLERASHIGVPWMFIEIEHAIDHDN